MSAFLFKKQRQITPALTSIKTLQGSITNQTYFIFNRNASCLIQLFDFHFSSMDFEQWIGMFPQAETIHATPTAPSEIRSLWNLDPVGAKAMEKEHDWHYPHETHPIRGLDSAEQSEIWFTHQYSSDRPLDGFYKTKEHYPKSIHLKRTHCLFRNDWIRKKYLKISTQDLADS